jgi:hypothetical protein
MISNSVSTSELSSASGPAPLFRESSIRSASCNRRFPGLVEKAETSAGTGVEAADPEPRLPATRMAGVETQWETDFFRVLIMPFLRLKVASRL